MRHGVECGGTFVLYTIREHHYTFMQCDKCKKYLGGPDVEANIKRLMKIKVNPTIRRA